MGIFKDKLTDEQECIRLAHYHCAHYETKLKLTLVGTAKIKGWNPFQWRKCCVSCGKDVDTRPL